MADLSVNVKMIGHSPVGQRLYATTFSLTENPLSESGLWRNGETDGIDWQDVQTTGGTAYGTGSSGGPPYDDPTAIISGIWAPDQAAQATIVVAHTETPTSQEIELRLRSTLAGHVNLGYEVLLSTLDAKYVNIVRWNGDLDDFDILASGTFGAALVTGDVITATIVGATITAYLNGGQILQTTDTAHSSGNPGIGFWLRGTGSVFDAGVSEFSAWEL